MTTKSKLDPDVWKGYSARDAGDCVGMSESGVRACVRAGLLNVDPKVHPMELKFGDLHVLRIVKNLCDGGLSPRRVRRELKALRDSLPESKSLSEFSLVASGRHILVEECSEGNRSAWFAHNGQRVFNFSPASPEYLQPVGACIIPFPLAEEKKEKEIPQGAQECFERALEVEDEDPAQAIALYTESLKYEPNCVETLINVGRVYAENGAATQAELVFSKALRIDPNDSTAAYNLGVVAQDDGRDGDAISFYHRALGLEPNLPEAHYNLATILDREGDQKAAIRHLNAYRKLIKGRS